MKYIYFVNRFSLLERTDECISRLKQASEHFHRDYEIVLNETIRDAAASIERYKDSENVITAIGGDGSINRLLNDFAGTGNILSFIPAGTGNDFARTCMDHLADGIHDIDLIRVNDRYCINVACFGIDADIANDDTWIHNRLIPRPMRFNAGVVYHFLRHKKGRRLQVECQGHSFDQAFTTIIAANSCYYGGGYHVSPGSVLNDGIMEVYLVDSLGKLRMARTILSIKDGSHLQSPAVRVLRAKKLTISSSVPFRANIDGEPLLSDHFDLELIPGGIRLDYNRRFLQYLTKAAL